MKEISPLGEIAIAILVARWNASKNERLKYVVEKLLSSGDTLQARLAEDNIVKLSDTQLRECRFIWSGTVPITTKHLLTAIGTAMMDTLEKGNQASATSKLLSKALEEATDYFAKMIKLGHFKKLPLPEFGYEMEPVIVVETRILSSDGKMSVGGPHGRGH